MTSKSDNLKTNEFIRLRKLRLQQVREQSKDIAKIIRQRARVEQLRHVSNINVNKEKEYLQQQEKLVNRLEELYSKSLKNVGAGHKNASEVNGNVIAEKKDLSKLRGKEAVAELKKKKQEKLNEQKKILDRKLQAREVANNLSREKCNVVANTLMKSSSNKSGNENQDKDSDYKGKDNDNGVETHIEKPESVIKNDMGTQWEFEEIPNEWEPNVPSIHIPNDDSIKNSAVDNLDKLDKTKRLNLFALSDEMPSSLRGGITSIPDDIVPIKPSLTLVSEYLQNRGLRLREPDTSHFHKKSTDDLQSIKQTLLRTRASRTDGSVFPNICHVLDEQVIPVPCWRQEKKCEFCCHVNTYTPQNYQKGYINSFIKSSNLRSGLQNHSMSCQKPKGYQRPNMCHHGDKTPVSGRSNNIGHMSISDDTNRGLRKKNSVTMYDHNTRDVRDLPHNVDKFVARDPTTEDDAYSQAVKETSVVDNENNGMPHHMLQQETRNRLAITRQNVDKEYRDTMAFLNSLPKERPAACIKTAYMDGERQQELKDRRQQKLQQEYKKIEKQCSKHHSKHPRQRTVLHEDNRSKSKSPVGMDIDNDVVNRDFPYSWLPVPESDGSLAIHSIQNTVNNNKHNRHGNTVKFSSVDTYHEYRSRHKHTPPTKDVDHEPSKRLVEAVIIQENSNDSMDSSSDTDTSSVENLRVKQDTVFKNNKDGDKQLADAERIIIYKIMESKKAKKHKPKKKIAKGNNVDNSPTTKQADRQQESPNVTSGGDIPNVKANTVSFTQLKEGIYKSVSANGDNIASLYFSEDPQEGECNPRVKSNIIGKEQVDHGVSARKLIDESDLQSKAPACHNCNNSGTQKNTDKLASAATSTSSFKTAVNSKVNNVILDGGSIKFIDEGGQQDAGKFYVGASGFLKDDAYEVIIQLRKKEAEKANTVLNDKNIIETRSSPEKITKLQELGQQSTVIGLNKEENILPPESTESPLDEQCDILSLSKTTVTHEQIPTKDKKNSTPKESYEHSSKQDQSKVDPPKITEKSISTSYRDSFAIPDNMPKLDTIQKQVTSNYTQTTQNSPMSRPVLMHLSSSTSTTYMSPPELILPSYLRKGGIETCDDTYEPVSSNLFSQNTRTTDCKASRCRKCNKREKRPKTYTPPNTTRSTDETADNIQYDKPYQKNTGTKFRHIRQHKCKNNSESKICSKQKFKRSCSESKRLHSGSNYTVLSIQKGKVTNNAGKSNVNPVIEKYIKQLLALNKDGLKAIEVVNQECSAVDTPSSSIINVPNNINKNKPTVNKQISLEQIKNSLKKQILKDIGDKKCFSKCTVKTTGSQTDKMIKLLYKPNRKRSVHKVKSLNISKQLTKSNKENRRQTTRSTEITTSPCSVNTRVDRRIRAHSNVVKINPQNKNTPTSRQIVSNQDTPNNSSYSESNKGCMKPTHKWDKTKLSKPVTKINTDSRLYPAKAEINRESQSHSRQSNRATSTSRSTESEVSDVPRNRRNLSTPPISISTQTKQIDSEVEFMKLAESKLQNMEKIADLTEKCTQRLSNLAKVLEEVRRNKSLVYSQFSTSDSISDSDQKPNNKIQTNKNPVKLFNLRGDIPTSTEILPSLTLSPQETKTQNVSNVSTYVPILKGLPKPETLKIPTWTHSKSDANIGTEQQLENNKVDVNIGMDQLGVKHREKPPLALSILTGLPKPETWTHSKTDANIGTEQQMENNKVDVNVGMDQQGVKHRGKPPPALSRINFKHVPEGFIIPHELSTVVEVDSPMSMKLKSHSTQFDNKEDDAGNDSVDDMNLHDFEDKFSTPDIIKKSSDQSSRVPKFNMSKSGHKTQTTDSSDDSKIKMMDLKHFNDIMLKPFITLQEYAKYNIEEFEGRSNFNGVLKDENPHDELSSLNSDASLPDVMAELLKRNLISEPFKFETTSNVNSTTMSSESTLSLLALSRARKERKKSTVLVKNKENTVENSVSLSISSNPDLEHAFQRLGMGWASSTLKKTKERLALSSSSNTSSSSLPQFKIKSFNYQDVPEISSLNFSDKDEVVKTHGKSVDTPKNALQQTSLTNSMTVKEFLANELAKKITFSNKSNRNTTDDEFISLCETKMPEEMKRLTQKSEENEKSVDSVPSGTNNRARTSTPVQIYKSMTYHSTSSSNTSNGLFSNADDLSSVKGTSNSVKNHSTSDKDDLTIPNYSLKTRTEMSECTKSD